MLKDVIEVRPLQGHRLYVRFEDGAEGEVDLDTFIEFDGVFAPLRQRQNFTAVEVHPELGTVVWPCGADLDPDVLYARVTGQALPTYEVAEHES
jgi:hypothetical protein